VFEHSLPDEVLIIDDGSDDGCEELCREFDVRYIYNHRPKISLSSQARNVGIRNTTCDLIVTSGPELMFVSDVIAQMRERFDGTQTISAGTVYTSPHEGVTDPDACEDNGFGPWFTTLCPRAWFEAVGGWDEQMPGDYGFEDCDLHRRLNVSRGHKLHEMHVDVAVREIKVLHQWHYSSIHIDGGMNLNGAYHDSKLAEWGSSPDPVANRGVEWGVVLDRP